MTEDELLKILKTIGIPIAYMVFPEDEKPSAPYGIFRREDDEHIFADDEIYHTSQNIVFEVYVKQCDKVLEKKIKDLFANYGILYDLSEAYLKEERLIMLIYEFNI